MFTFDSLDNLDFFLAARSFQMGPKAEQPPLAWFFGCFMVYSCPPTRCLSFVFSGSPGILAENLTEFLNACLLYVPFKVKYISTQHPMLASEHFLVLLRMMRCYIHCVATVKLLGLS